MLDHQPIVATTLSAKTELSGVSMMQFVTAFVELENDVRVVPRELGLTNRVDRLEPIHGCHHDR
jgi:hypothetical protein